MVGGCACLLFANTLSAKTATTARSTGSNEKEEGKIVPPAVRGLRLTDRRAGVYDVEDWMEEFGRVCRCSKDTRVERVDRGQRTKLELTVGFKRFQLSAIECFSGSLAAANRLADHSAGHEELRDEEGWQ